MDGHARPQRGSTSGDNADPDLLAVNIANELAELEAQPVLRPGIEALRRVWAKHYFTIGHRRLGRALLGRSRD